jgi:folate-binding protein YgfZ
VAELEATRHGAVLGDRSDLGRIAASGRDILDLLHRLSTQDLKGLATGTGRSTVLTTAKGRIVERLFVFALAPRRVLLVGGGRPQTASRVVDHLTRYTFSEDTGLMDVTGATALLSGLGPGAAEAVARAGLPCPAPLSCLSAEVAAVPTDVLGFDGDTAAGISFVVPAETATAVGTELLGRLESQGVIAAGSIALEARSVIDALPIAGAELTEEHNPLEAGLWDAVSFTKGCYVGQEVVARLRTYDRVSRRLVSLAFAPGAAPPEPGTEVFLDGRPVGSITRAMLPPGMPAPRGIAYIRRDAARPGVELRAGAGDAAAVAWIDRVPAEGPSGVE